MPSIPCYISKRFPRLGIRSDFESVPTFSVEHWDSSNRAPSCFTTWPSLKTSTNLRIDDIGAIFNRTTQMAKKKNLLRKSSSIWNSNGTIFISQDFICVGVAYTAGIKRQCAITHTAWGLNDDWYRDNICSRSKQRTAQRKPRRTQGDPQKEFMLVNHANTLPWYPGVKVEFNRCRQARDGCIRNLTFSFPSSKSIFSQRIKETCMSEVVRIGSVVIFHSLSKLGQAKFSILWCNIPGEAAGETWKWSLLGVIRVH